MKPLAYRVLKLLADGDFRSGEAMARTLGVSRASVWQAAHELEATGLDLYQVRGRGYRLAQPLSLLDVDAVRRHLGPAAGRVRLAVLDSIESTNSALMQRAQGGEPDGAVIAAEWQTAGRGRHGRAWLSGIGGALTFSVLWRFARGANELAGLSLAAGVMLARALEALGAGGVALKWPNDILWREEKVAGILIELHGDILGPTAAVIGIGVNVRLPDALKRGIDQPATDLETACGTVIDRNDALGRVLREMVPALDTFARDGFGPFQREWTERHVHQGRRVNVLLPDARCVHGVARGVSENGALLVETRAGLQRFHSGEVSVRSAAGQSVRA